MKKYLLLIPLLFSSLLFSSLTHAAIDWNDQQVVWHSYPEGVAKAKREHKNMIVVVYADWCGHCAAYAKMFRDPEVVRQSQGVVLVRINDDKDPSAKVFIKDDQYVPRTYILDQNAKIQPSPFQKNEHVYHLPEGSSDYLARLMRQLGHR